MLSRTVSAYSTSLLTPTTTPSCSQGGVLFNKSGTALLKYPAGRSDTYTISDGVEIIGCQAFVECQNLTGVNIAASVINIEEYAFQYCTGLTAVTIPDGVTHIGTGAFYSCPYIVNVTIGKNVTHIGKYAFNRCESLTSVTFSGSIVTYIGEEAFANCSSLNNIYFTGNMPQAGYYAFGSCPGTIYFLPGSTGWASWLGGCRTDFWNPTFGGTTPSANGCKLTVTGNAYIPVAIEATTNLRTGPWVRLHTTTLTDGTLQFTDEDSSNHQTRFYRIVGP